MYFGNTFITSPIKGDSADKHSEMISAVSQMPISKQSDVSFDYTAVREEVEQLNNLFMEYSELFYGESENVMEDLKLLQIKTEELGIEKVITELNRQIKDN